jgi:hypothetical protein
MSRYHADLPSHSYFGDEVARHLVTAASVHEASHMTVAALGGLPMEDMSVMLHVGGKQDMSVSGVTRIDIEKELFDRWARAGDEKAVHWMLACAAGQTGEALWVEQCKPGFNRERSLEYSASGACSDYEMFHFVVRKYGLRITWEDAQANARRLLLNRWEWVMHEAHKLYRSGFEDLRRVQLG